MRSSGPGGQNVNKVASKVERRVDLGRVEGLTRAQRERLEALVEPRRRRATRPTAASREGGEED